VRNHRDEIAFQLVQLLKTLILLFHLLIRQAQGMGSFLHLLFQLRIELLQLPVQHLQVAVACLESGLLAFLVAQVVQRPASSTWRLSE